MLVKNSPQWYSFLRVFLLQADVQLSLVPPVISKLEEDEKVCYQGETRDVTSNADVMKGSLLVSAALFVISKLL